MSEAAARSRSSYEFEHLPLGVSMRLAVHPSAEFGDVDVRQISGPRTMTLSPGHLMENDVSFRIERRDVVR